MKIVSDPIYFDKESEIPSPYTSNPEMDGTASPGTSSLWSRGDHRHPSDTTKQDLLTFDSSPTTNSNNPVTSSGIYDYVVSLLPQETATGNPANFPDGANNVEILDLDVNIDINQSGTGVPSPTNVRTITPWTGLTLYHSGSNTSEAEELTISWQSAVGSIWSGKLDITSGELSEFYYDASSDARNLVVTGSTPNNTVQARFSPTFQNFSAVIVSDRFSNLNGSGQSGMIARVILDNVYWVYLNIPQDQLEGTTTEDVQAWVASNNPVILLQRNSPSTTLISNHELHTLLGENNFWANTGDTTVKYRSDVNLYLQKKRANM